MTRPLFGLIRSSVIACTFLTATAGAAAAQTVPATELGSGVLGTAIARAFATDRTTATGMTQGGMRSDDGWRVGIYPVFVWLPTGIDIDVDLPPDSGGAAGKIVDSRFDGAYLGGFYASKDWFRFDADGVWAAIGGDREQPPRLTVDVDLIYFHAAGGVRVAPGFYATAGIRRLALKYTVLLAGFPEFERKPGIWDPVIGIGYHYEGEGKPLEFHAAFEGGGFGVGADQEWAATARVDWKPIRHFGVTGGYNFLYYKVTNTVANREFIVRQSVHGPLFGIGLYF